MMQLYNDTQFPAYQPVCIIKNPDGQIKTLVCTPSATTCTVLAPQTPPANRIICSTGGYVPAKNITGTTISARFASLENGPRIMWCEYPLCLKNTLYGHQNIRR